MNERIAELYNRAIVLEGNGDYTAGELDPVKFAELLVRECASLAYDGPGGILDHFGVEE